MDTLLNHLNEVSLFGVSEAALFLIIGINFAITLIHTLQEWKGSEVPLWRNFGAIVGVRVPDWLGFALFTLGLTLGLWTIGLIAFAGWLPVLGEVSKPAAITALGVLIGARVSDTLISHLLMHFLGYRPNPGLSSTPLYIAEAVFILIAFREGLASDPTAAWTGVIAGFSFFLFVQPLLWILRLIVPSWRRVRWMRGKSIPDWAKLT